VTDARYVRQVILPEIGEAGQARLASASVRVGGGTSGEIEAAYLRAAGVGSIERGDADDSDAPAFGITDASARDVALGAWRALRTMRAIVRGGA
jgi:molybdopterin/thiamine biosynthesis adenylyltransferase